MEGKIEDCLKTYFYNKEIINSRIYLNYASCHISIIICAETSIKDEISESLLRTFYKEVRIAITRRKSLKSYNKHYLNSHYENLKRIYIVFAHNENLYQLSIEVSSGYVEWYNSSHHLIERGIYKKLLENTCEYGKIEIYHKLIEWQNEHDDKLIQKFKLGKCIKDRNISFVFV